MLLLWLLVACSKDSASGPPGADFTWAGGDFDFYTLQVEDACLGGALEALFMPEGPNQPHPFQYAIYVPSYDELPMSYSIDLREPFVGMPVTVTEGADGWFAVRGSVMEDVELGWASYGDCAVNMTVDVDLLPTSADTVEGEARNQMSDPHGEDQRCPVFEGDPCQVTLQLYAERS